MLFAAIGREPPLRGLWAVHGEVPGLAAAGKVEDGLNDAICRVGHELTEDIDVDATCAARIGKRKKTPITISMP